MNELIIELERRAATMTDDTPYCVLSRELVSRMIDALGQPPVEDPWLMEMQQKLTATEYRLYHVLYRARGKPVKNAVLLNYTGIEQLSTLWVHIRRLRVKAQVHGWGVIKTVKECGYFLELASGG